LNQNLYKTRTKVAMEVRFSRRERKFKTEGESVNHFLI